MGRGLLAFGYLQILPRYTPDNRFSRIDHFFSFFPLVSLALRLLLIGPRGTFYYLTVATPLEQSHFSGNTRSRKSEVRSITLYRISPTAPYQRECYRRLIKQSWLWMPYFPWEEMALKACTGGPAGGGKEPSVELNMLLLQIKHQCNSNESGNGGRRSEGWSIKSRHLHRSIGPVGIPVVSLI